MKKLTATVRQISLLLLVLSFHSRELVAEERIVSLAPSITETIFALGKGDFLVGVTKACDYPKEVRTLPRVGNFLSPQLETIIGLEPTLVIGLPENSKALENLGKLNIPTLVAPQDSVKSVINSIQLIGDTIGKSSDSNTLAKKISRRLKNLKWNFPSHPKVLITVGSGPSAEAPVYAAGPGSFLDEILEIAGGTNAYKGPLAYAALSKEGLLALDPDIILEIAPLNMPNSNWGSLPELRAVKNKQVFTLTNDFLARPGPRIAEAAEEIHKTLENITR